MEDLSIKIIMKDPILPDPWERGLSLNQIKNKFIRTEKNVNTSEFPVENIKTQLNNLINGIQFTLDNLPINSNYKLEEIKLTCGIDANGSITFGLANGSVGIKTAIEITLKKNE
jgi:hypothetical protein